MDATKCNPEFRTHHRSQTRENRWTRLEKLRWINTRERIEDLIWTNPLRPQAPKKLIYLNSNQRHDLFTDYAEREREKPRKIDSSSGTRRRKESPFRHPSASIPRLLRLSLSPSPLVEVDRNRSQNPSFSFPFLFKAATRETQFFLFII